eukprot:10274603-Heterocapsa_arctica.AAC.1
MREKITFPPREGGEEENFPPFPLMERIRRQGPNRVCAYTSASNSEQFNVMDGTEHFRLIRPPGGVFTKAVTQRVCAYTSTSTKKQCYDFFKSHMGIDINIKTTKTYRPFMLN